MSSKEKMKDKKENFEKKLKQKKEDFENKVKDRKQKIEEAIKTKKQEKSLLPPMFEMLIVVVNRGRGQAVLNYLKTIDVNLNIVSFGEGTAPNNVAGLLGFSQEKEVIFTVVNFKDSEKVLNLLDNIFLSTEKYAGIAFTIPLKSMTNNSLDTFLETNTLNNGGKK